MGQIPRTEKRLSQNTNVKVVAEKKDPRKHGFQSASVTHGQHGPNPQ